MLDSLRQFEKAIENFAQWMDIRKRPYKSNGGKILLSVIEELDCVQEAIEEYKDSFFLVNYIGKEDSVIDYLFMASIGEIDLERHGLDFCGIGYTTDAAAFFSAPDRLILYQKGLIAFHAAVKEQYRLDSSIVYKIDDFAYSAPILEKHIWNIFDEFALFLGLERFEALRETNRQLAGRCLAVFQNQANSSERGLKNAIINALMHYVALDEPEIQLERPDAENLLLTADGQNSVYEILAAINRDLFRYKVWDKSAWDHCFKELAYLPQAWDQKLEEAQDGTGHGDACRVLLSDGREHTTDVEVTGYRRSTVKIAEYVRKNKLAAKIALRLTKFKDVLKAKTVQYKITAAAAKKIDLRRVVLEEYEKRMGTFAFPLEDFVRRTSAEISAELGSALADAAKYRLKFRAADDFSAMEIQRCDLVSGSRRVDLRRETDTFALAGGVLFNKDVLKHLTAAQEFDSSENFVDRAGGGIAVKDLSQPARARIAIGGMSRKPLRIKHSCQAVNIDEDRAFVRAEGFTYRDGTFISDDTASANSIVIELECNCLSFEFCAADGGRQGAVTVAVYRGGMIDANLSKIITSPQRIVVDNNGNYAPVKVALTKAGLYPVAVRAIEAVRYEVKCWTDTGQLGNAGQSILLPQFTGENTLHMEVISYTQYAPVIEYVHIGASVKMAVYTLDLDTAPYSGAGGVYLDIRTNCRAALYRLENGKETLLDDGYETHACYRNSSAQEGYLELDISSIAALDYCNYKITDGRVYLQPGETAKDLIVTGTILKPLRKLPIAEFLDAAPAAEAYLSSLADGVIIVEQAGQRLARVAYGQLHVRANFVRLSGDGAVKGVFEVAGGKKTIASSYDGKFVSCYLTLEELSNQEYIAYQSVEMLRPAIDGVPLANTFWPLVDLSALLFYRIEAGAGSAVFCKRGGSGCQYAPWSLGYPEEGISVTADLDYGNTDSYACEVKCVENSHVIGQRAPLLDTDDIVYAQYIIQPPAHVSVQYEKQYFEEEVTVLEDGFNKLTFSNVESVVGLYAGTGRVEDFTLLAEPGILKWNRLDLAGETVVVKYYYLDPVYLTFDLDYLYEAVDYSLEAYQSVGAVKCREMSDGESRKAAFTTAVDKTVIQCSNYRFTAEYKNETVTAVLLSDVSQLMLHNGIYYKDGNEYYHFSDRYIDLNDNYRGLLLHNVIRRDGWLEFRQASKNYLPNSAFRTSVLRPLCDIDFAKTGRISGANKLNALGSCETYGSWRDYDMEISFVRARNQIGIEFRAGSKSAYAALDITRYVTGDSYISVLGRDMRLFLGEEVKVDGLRLHKSDCLRPLLELSRDPVNQTYQAALKDWWQSGVRYYLIAMGSGVMDEILVKDEPIDAGIHTKNLDRLGFQVEETAAMDQRYDLQFAGGNRLEGLDAAEDGTIVCGASIDWGLTRIYALSRESCYLLHVRECRDAFLSTADGGMLETKPIYVKNRANAAQVVVKVNDYAVGDLKDFKIELYTASSADGEYKLLDYQSEGNLLQALGGRLKSYVKVKVGMKENKVVQRLDVYVKYVEVEGENLNVTANQGGYLLTKVYDVGATGSFQPERVLLDCLEQADQVEFYMRGCRENAYHYVWTEWFKMELDEAQQVVHPATFEQYRLFQFKVELKMPEAKLRLKGFRLKAVG